MAHFLKGNNLELEAISLDHISDKYISWFHDKDVKKGLYSGRKPASTTSLESYIATTLANPKAIMFAIIYQSEHIGNIKIDNFDSISQTAELGILIGEKQHWGKGLGFEACQLVIDYAFNELNFRKILLSVFTNNPNATRLYEKLGFNIEGQLKEQVYIDGQYVDKIYMGLFKDK
ncbi:GNAT family protein [Lentisphaera profundi]|uniref:GNAT family protein n=1 Tax=Lentisphaera profundi TaxID=1658616 RepID=A0ABY7VVE0_9BACT|nr:GNAT family protein [Lentisphaera profundi]WDE98193.1 GNAT family protein [Lentisphaera profundi]